MRLDNFYSCTLPSSACVVECRHIAGYVPEAEMLRMGWTVGVWVCGFVFAAYTRMLIFGHFFVIKCYQKKKSTIQGQVCTKK